VRKKERTLAYYMSLDYPVTMETMTGPKGERVFGLEVPDLPGLWAHGASLDEAYAKLEENKKVWFEVCLKEGTAIPEPVSEEDFSGKFLLRLPPRLHRTAHLQAEREHVSLNQYVRTAISKHIEESELTSAIEELRKDVMANLDAVRKTQERMGQAINALQKAHAGRHIHIALGETVHLAATMPSNRVSEERKWSRADAN
jgi:antitoxin HicB